MTSNLSRLHRLNEFMRRNLAWMLLIITICFAWVAADSAQDTQKILENTNNTVAELEKIIIGQGKQDQQRARDTRDIKNAVFCLLAQHDPENFPTDLDGFDCADVINDFTSPTPTDAPASKNNAPQNQNNNRPSPSDDSQGGGEDNRGPIRKTIDALNPLDDLARIIF